MVSGKATSHVGVHWCDLGDEPIKCLAIGLRQQDRGWRATRLWRLRKDARLAGFRLVRVDR